MAGDVLRSAGGGGTAWTSGAAERQFLHRDGPGFASDDVDPEELAAAFESDCLFEIFRADEERMTSTLFSGGDWRWRLVTTEGMILAEAAGYPNEGLCRAAVLVLQRRAAAAPIMSVREPT
jgi:uncharacterized protein YegP (UPF0339 family)